MILKEKEASSTLHGRSNFMPVRVKHKRLFLKILEMLSTKRSEGLSQGIYIKSRVGWIFLIVLSFFSILFFVGSGLANSVDSYQVSRRDKAFGVHFTDEKSGWVVGDNGLALKTADGGDNWQRIKVTDETLNDVFFVGERGWIVGGSRLILHTDDGGKSWKNQLGSPRQSPDKTTMALDVTRPGVEGPAKSLMKVFFKDQDRGFTVGADGTILMTKNGGMVWEDVSLECLTMLPEELLMNGIVSINLYDILFVSPDSGWIVGDSGAILHSEDGGRQWQIKNIGLLPPLFSISFRNEKVGWAVGQNGFSLKTVDGGETWEQVIIEKVNSLYQIKFCDNYGVIVGDQATVLKSSDGGVSWDRIGTHLPPPFPWFSGVWIFPSNSGKALSIGKGIILKTEISEKK